MTLNIREGLSLDDVLLVPQHSTVKSRKDVDVSVELSKGLKISSGIIPAPMKTISGGDMISAVHKSGGMGIYHRFMPWAEQMAACISANNTMVNAFDHIGFSVGAKSEDYDKVDWFVSQGVKILNIDMANGHSDLCINMTKYIATKYPQVFLISGNVATRVGARDLWEAGADAVRVSIGNGSLCSTRIQTGNGVPLLTALSDVAYIRLKLTDNYASPQIKKPLFIIADGSCKTSGDLVKAFCFADLVFSGNLFASCEETPGDIAEINGEKYKSYEGSSTHQTSNIEGVKALVKCKGTYNEVMTKLLDGLRSGMSYQNAHTMKQLQDNPEFVRITNNGLIESRPNVEGIIKQ